MGCTASVHVAADDGDSENSKVCLVFLNTTLVPSTMPWERELSSNL